LYTPSVHPAAASWTARWSIQTMTSHPLSFSASGWKSLSARASEQVASKLLYRLEQKVLNPSTTNSFSGFFRRLMEQF